MARMERDQGGDGALPPALLHGRASRRAEGQRQTQSEDLLRALDSRDCHGTGRETEAQTPHRATQVVGCASPEPL